MGVRSKKVVALVAVYLIALQAILIGFAPAAVAYDSITGAVICHSDGTTTADTANAPAAQLPQGCNHCILCSTTPQTNAPDPDAILAFAFVPGDTVALPVSAAPLTPATTLVHLARGPPRTV